MSWLPFGQTWQRCQSAVAKEWVDTEISSRNNPRIIPHPWIIDFDQVKWQRVVLMRSIHYLVADSITLSTLRRVKLQQFFLLWWQEFSLWATETQSCFGGAVSFLVLMKYIQIELSSNTILYFVLYEPFPEGRDTPEASHTSFRNNASYPVQNWNLFDSATMHCNTNFCWPRLSRNAFCISWHWCIQNDERRKSGFAIFEAKVLSSTRPWWKTRICCRAFELTISKNAAN